MGTLGNRKEAEETLQRLEAMRAAQHVSAMDSALITLALGRLDETFHWLEKAVKERSGWLVYVKTHGRLDPLRGDARFQSLLRRVELANP